MDGISELRERMGGTEDLSALISGIMSDPALASTVTSLASALKSSASGTSEPVAEAEESTAEPAQDSAAPASEVSLSGGGPPSSAVSALAPLLKGLSGGGVPDDRRACLLKALKPYLSPARCEAIDHIITLSRLSGLFKSV